MIYQSTSTSTCRMVTFAVDLPGHCTGLFIAWFVGVGFCKGVWVLIIRGKKQREETNESHRKARLFHGPTRVWNRLGKGSQHGEGGNIDQCGRYCSCLPWKLSQSFLSNSCSEKIETLSMAIEVLTLIAWDNRRGIIKALSFHIIQHQQNACFLMYTVWEPQIWSYRYHA